MHRRLAIVISAALLALGAGAAALVAQAASTSSGHKGSHGAKLRQFLGYWMGIDPLDGGDSRRGITRGQGETVSLIGRDTVFTLCDNSDRAIVTMEGARISGAVLAGEFVIRCTNTGDTVRLNARYRVIDRGVIREVLTSPTGQPVDEIIFHRISAR